MLNSILLNFKKKIDNISNLSTYKWFLIYNLISYIIFILVWFTNYLLSDLNVNIPIVGFSTTNKDYTDYVFNFVVFLVKPTYNMCLMFCTTYFIIEGITISLMDVDMAIAFDPMWRNLEKCYKKWAADNNVGGSSWNMFWETLRILFWYVMFYLWSVIWVFLEPLLSYIWYIIGPYVMPILKFILAITKPLQVTSFLALIGTNTIFIVLTMFTLYSIIVSLNTISLFIKLICYLSTFILYLIVLNLDPWACFLIIVEFSAILLLVIVLNSLKYNSNVVSAVNLSKYIYVFIALFMALLVHKLPNSNLNIFYSNLYLKNNFYSNTDFFGLVIELFGSSFIVPLIILLLLVVTVYIIIRFKFNSSNSDMLVSGTISTYLNSKLGISYVDLIDEYFLLVKPTVNKWFSSFK